MSAASRGRALSARARLARHTVRVVNAASKRAGRGAGTVIGGRAGLALDPQLLSHLSAGRTVALVSGTNGKTTTTALLVSALGPHVVTNRTGSNMPPGHVAALSGSHEALAVLEVDEAYLPRVITSTQPRVVVCLNLSRDQLDRNQEVRFLAQRWRDALAGLSADQVVVANADDPLVTYAAAGAPHVRWVAAGLGWRDDATGCPVCTKRIHFDDDSRHARWSCSCGFARPDPEVVIEGDMATFGDGATVVVTLAIPGEFNRANAVMATMAAEELGVTRHVALAAMAQGHDLGGRYAQGRFGDVTARKLLAKNPAGFAELLAVVSGGQGPVVVAINARTADGADPSWLWDVAFEQLAGRPVVACGDRCLDLSVRLHYGAVDHQVQADPARALVLAASLAPGAVVDYVANYTAFFDLKDG